MRREGLKGTNAGSSMDQPKTEKAIVQDKITPQEMIHVGDHNEFDYLSPQKLGITSYYLDRKKNTRGTYVVSDLKQFEKKIQQDTR